MAQVKLLKIAADGVPLEFASASDEITLASFTVQGGGPVLGATGLDMNGQDVSDLSDLVFTDPAVGTINQTAGALVVDNLMAKERNNVMTSAGAILFPLVTDTAAQLDSFKVPNIAGAPTATPAFSATGGYMVYDTTGKNLYAWTGTEWDNLESSDAVENTYTAGEDIDTGEVVYISAANTVSLALGTNTAAAQAMGFATQTVLSAASLNVKSDGVATGLTGLTAGLRYYVSPSTPGAVTSTTPVGSGNTLVQVGYAKSATELAIQFQQLGRRA